MGLGFGFGLGQHLGRHGGVGGDEHGAMRVLEPIAHSAQAGGAQRRLEQQLWRGLGRGAAALPRYPRRGEPSHLGEGGGRGVGVGVLGVLGVWELERWVRTLGVTLGVWW